MSPSPLAVHVLICYDIGDDKRRGKLGRRLEGYGRRLQKSVFEAWLCPEMLDQLLDECLPLIDPDQDRLCMYELCASCASGRRAFGLGADEAPLGELRVIVI